LILAETLSLTWQIVPEDNFLGLPESCVYHLEHSCYNHSASRTALVSPLKLTTMLWTAPRQGRVFSWRNSLAGSLHHVSTCLPYKPVQSDPWTKFFLNSGKWPWCRCLNLLDSTWKSPLQISLLEVVFSGRCVLFWVLWFTTFPWVVEGADLATVNSKGERSVVWLVEWLPLVPKVVCIYSLLALLSLWNNLWALLHVMAEHRHPVILLFRLVRRILLYTLHHVCGHNFLPPPKKLHQDFTSISLRMEGGFLLKVLPKWQS
jgi:hypothetical protein